VTNVGSYWLVTVTLLASLLLAVYPVAPPYGWLRPDWTAMVIIFWAITVPDKIGVGYAWLAGLVLDGFTGATLGQNALGLAIVAYICGGLYQRMRNFAPLQQAALVFVLVGLHLLVGYWVQSLTSSPAHNLYFLLAALSSAVLWPLFSVLMSNVAHASTRR
jgi:rod shape-determining protein MreD